MEKKSLINVFVFKNIYLYYGKRRTFIILILWYENNNNAYCIFVINLQWSMDYSNFVDSRTQETLKTSTRDIMHWHCKYDLGFKLIRADCLMNYQSSAAVPLTGTDIQIQMARTEFVGSEKVSEAIACIIDSTTNSQLKWNNCF